MLSLNHLISAITWALTLNSTPYKFNKNNWVLEPEPESKSKVKKKQNHQMMLVTFYWDQGWSTTAERLKPNQNN